MQHRCELHMTYRAVLLALTASSCSPSSKLGSAADIKLNFQINIDAGDGQEVLPRASLSTPLQFRVLDKDGHAAPATRLQFCLINLDKFSVTNAQDVTPTDLIQRCNPSTQSASSVASDDEPVNSSTGMTATDTVGLLAQKSSITDSNGLATAQVQAPAVFAAKIGVVAMIQGAGTQPVAVLARFQTASVEKAGFFALDTTGHLQEAAGESFGMFFRVVDKDGFQFQTFQGTREFQITHDLRQSWAGNSSDLPTGKFSCVFKSGICQVPKGPWQIAPAGKAMLHIKDATADRSLPDVALRVKTGPENNYVVASGLAADAQAQPLGNVILSFGESLAMSAYVVDKGGNQLRAATEAQWQISNNKLGRNLPSSARSDINFISTASGQGDLTVKGALGVSPRVAVDIRAGRQEHWKVTTEHNNSETAGECFTVSVAAADTSGNINPTIEGSWNLNLSFGGITESGPFVRDRAHWTTAAGSDISRRVSQTVNFIAGTATLPIKACFYDASNVSPTIEVSGAPVGDALSLVDGSQRVQVNLGVVNGIDLMTKPYGDQTASAPCAGGLGDQPDAPCLDYSVDDAPGRLYVATVDKGGNPITPATGLVWAASGPLASVLNGQSNTDFAYLAATTPGSGALSISADGGYSLKKYYRVSHGAPASFIIASEHDGVETTTSAFITKFKAYDKYDNLCDTFSGERIFALTLLGAVAGPAPKSVAPLAAFSETVHFRLGAAVSVGKLQAPRATIIPNSATVVKPVITSITAGKSFASKAIVVNSGTPVEAHLYGQPGGVGRVIQAPLNLQRGSPLAVNVASFDEYGNFVRDELSSFVGSVDCQIAGTGCPYDPLSAHVGIATTFVPNQVGSGGITAAPMDSDVAPVTLGPINVISSVAESYTLNTSNSLREKAGVPFQITIQARDHDNNIAAGYDGVKTLNFFISTQVSWSGLPSVLPSGNIDCTFIQGVCTLSDANGPLNFVVNDSRRRHIITTYDVSGQIPNVWSAIISAIAGAAEKIAITSLPVVGTEKATLFKAERTQIDEVNGVPPAFDMTADRSPFTLYAGITDAGGNLLGPATTAVWSGTPAIIAPYLSSTQAGQVSFSPTKVGSGVITASVDGISPSSTPIFHIYHGVAAKIVMDTEHHMVEQAGVSFAISKIQFVDAKENPLDDWNYGPVKIETSTYEPVAKIFKSTSWSNSFVAKPAIGRGELRCQDTSPTSACLIKDSTSIGSNLVGLVGPYVKIRNGIIDPSTGLTGILYDVAAKAPTLRVKFIDSQITDDQNILRAYPAPFDQALAATSGVRVVNSDPDHVYFHDVDSTYPKSTNTDVAPIRLTAGGGPVTILARISDKGGNDLGVAKGTWSISVGSLAWFIADDLNWYERHSAVNPIPTTLSLIELNTLKSNWTDADDGSNLVITPRVATVAKFGKIDDSYATEVVAVKMTDSSNGLNGTFYYGVNPAPPTAFAVGQSVQSYSTSEGYSFIKAVLFDKYDNAMAAPGSRSDYPLSVAWHNNVTPINSPLGDQPSLLSATDCGDQKKADGSRVPVSCPSLVRAVLLPMAGTPTSVDVNVGGLGTKTVNLMSRPGSPSMYRVIGDPGGPGAPIIEPNFTITADTRIRLHTASLDKFGNFISYEKSTYVTTTAGIWADNYMISFDGTNFTYDGNLRTGTSPLSFAIGPIIIDLGNITVIPGLPAALTTGSSPSVTAGVPFDLSLSIRDRSSNLCSQFSGSTPVSWGMNSFEPSPEGATYELPNVTTIDFFNGTSITPISAKLFSASKLSSYGFNLMPRIVASITTQNGVFSGYNSFSVSPNIPDHYGIDITLPDLGNLYIPRSDGSTKFRANITLRDAWGNFISNQGESGVALTVVNEKDSSDAVGSLTGAITDINLSSGAAVVDNLAWNRNGRFQLRAAKTSGGRYSTPVGLGSKASDVLVALATPAVLQNYSLSIRSTATAGQNSQVLVSALDSSGQVVADPFIDSSLSALAYTWSGASTAPDGSAGDFPLVLHFVNGISSADITFHKSETIPAGRLKLKDSQSQALSGVAANAIEVQSGLVDLYQITSNQVSRMANATSTFDLTVSAFDLYKNLTNGEPNLALSATRKLGPSNIGNLYVAGSGGQPVPRMDLSANSLTIVRDLYYLVPQTVEFALDSNKKIKSDQVTFVANSDTVTAYKIDIAASTMVAGTNNVNATVSAVDIEGNVVANIDSALNSLPFLWTLNGSALSASMAPSQLNFDKGIATVSLSVTKSQIVSAGALSLSDQYPAAARIGSNKTGFNIIAAPATHLSMSGVGLDTTVAIAGHPFDIALTAFDQYENIDTSFSGGSLTFAWRNANNAPLDGSAPKFLVAANAAFNQGKFSTTNKPFTLYNASDIGVALTLVNPLLATSELKFTVATDVKSLIKIQTGSEKASSAVSGTTVNATADDNGTSYYAHSYDAWGNWIGLEPLIAWSGSGNLLDILPCTVNCRVFPASGVSTIMTPNQSGSGRLTASASFDSKISAAVDFQIAPGAPKSLTISPSTTKVIAGKPFTVTLKAQDKNNNDCANYTAQQLVSWQLNNISANAEGKSWEPLSVRQIQFTNGASAPIAMTIYNSAFQTPPTLTATFTNSNGKISGSYEPISISADVPHHYGIAVTGCGGSGGNGNGGSTNSCNYSPAADFSRKFEAQIQLRDQWGNQATGTGETGVALSMWDLSNDTVAVGSLSGKISDIDLSSGSATIKNLAWARPGTYQLRAGKPANGIYVTPSPASTTINATPTLATIASYLITSPSPMTAGIQVVLSVTAVDVSLIPINGIDRNLNSLQFSWSGPANSPIGDVPNFGVIDFAQGVAPVLATFYKAETFGSGGITLRDNQTTPVAGSLFSSLTVLPSTTIGHYEVRSSATSTTADSNGAFNLTISCVDLYGNQRAGENAIQLDVVSSNGPANIGPLHVGGTVYYPNGVWTATSTPRSNPYILNMAANNLINLTGVYYQVPQTISFKISGSSAAASTTISDQIALTATAKTIVAYEQNLSSTSVAAGPSNMTVSIAAQDEGKNTVTGLDGILNARVFKWNYSVITSGVSTAVLSDVAPDGTHDILLGSPSAFSEGRASAAFSLYNSGTKSIKLTDNATPAVISGPATPFTVTGATSSHLVMIPTLKWNNNSAVALVPANGVYPLNAGAQYDLRIEARDAFENIDTNYTSTLLSTVIGLGLQGASAVPGIGSPFTLALGAQSGTPSSPSGSLQFTAGVMQTQSGDLRLLNSFDTSPVLRMATPPLPTASIALKVLPLSIGSPTKTLVQAGPNYSSTAYYSNYPTVAADVAAFNLYAHQYDRYGNWIDAQTVNWSGSGVLSNGLCGIPEVSPTTSSPSTLITACKSGTGTLTVSSTSSPSSTLSTVNFTVTNGTPTKYSVSLSGAPEPTQVTANSSFSVDITALDAKGNVATSYTPTSPLTYSLQGATNTSAAPTACSVVTPGASTPTFNAGKATVSGFTVVNTADTNFNVKVTGDLTAGISGNKSVLPGTPTNLYLIVNSSATAATVVSGTAGFDATVNVVDRCSNLTTNYANDVGLTFTLTGATSSVENTNGPSVPVANGKMVPKAAGTITTTGGSFKVYKRTGTNYDGTPTLKASCTLASGCAVTVNSNTVSLTVSPGLLHHHYLQTSNVDFPLPSSKIATATTLTSNGAGTSATYYAWGYDYYGNAIGLQNVNWSKASVTNASLSATSAISATTLTPGVYAGGTPASTGSETVTATCSTCSSTIVTITQPISVGTANKFTVTAPSVVTANAAFNATVTAVDYYSNPVTSYPGAKTLTISMPGASASAAAPTSCNPIMPSGVVTFPASGSNSSITLSGFQAPELNDVFTIQVAGASMVTSSSNNITVNASGPATKLWLTVGGSGSSATPTAGTAFDAIVQAKDACSNLVNTGSGSLTFAFTGATSSLETATAPLVPTTGSISLTSGTVTTTGGKFNLYKRTGTNYDGIVTLQATCNSCAYTPSNAVTLTVTPGTPNHFYVQNSNSLYPLPSSALSGTLTSLPAQNTVTYYPWGYDQYGNATAQVSAAWTKGTITNATISPASGTSSTLTPGNYSASPPSLGNETITAAVSGMTSSSITVTQPIVYGPLASFSVTSSAGTTLTAGTLFDVTLKALDLRGNTVGDASAAYPLAWSWGGTNTTAPGGQAPALDSSTSRTFANGQWTSSGSPFAIYSANATAAYIRVAAGTPGGQTGNFTVNAANATTLAVTNTPTPIAGTANSTYQLTLKDTYGNPSTVGCVSTTMTAACTTAGACDSPVGHGGTVTPPSFNLSPWSQTSSVYSPNITLYKAGSNSLTFTACGRTAIATPTVGASNTVNAIYLAAGSSDPGTEPATSATSLSCTSGNNVSCQNLYAYAFDAYGNTFGTSWSCPAWTVTNANSTPFNVAAYVPSLTSASGHSTTTSGTFAYHMNNNITCTANTKTATALAGPTKVTNRPYTFGPFANWSCNAGNPTSTAMVSNSSGYDLSGVTFSGQNAGNTNSGCASSVTGAGSAGTCALTVTGTAGTASGTISPTGTIAAAESTYATIANPAGISVQSGANAPNCATALSVASSGWSCVGAGSGGAWQLTLTVTNANGLTSDTLSATAATFATQAGATIYSNTCNSATLTPSAGNSCGVVLRQTTAGNTSTVQISSSTAYFSGTPTTFSTEALPSGCAM